MLKSLNNAFNKSMLALAAFVILCITASSSLFSQGSSATLTLVSQPKHVVNCYGSTGNILATLASVTFTTTVWDVYYQWYKETPTGFVAYSAPVINGSSLTFPALKDSMAGAYYCNVWAQDRGFPNDVTPVQTSQIRVISILQGTSITEQPMSMFGNVGETHHLTFKSHVYGTYGNAPTYAPTVQWFRDTVRAVAPNIGKLDTVTLADNSVYDGTKSSILSIMIDNAKRYGNYWATVSGQCGGATTAKAGLQAYPTVTINTQPKDASVCDGTEVMFNVAASSSNSSSMTYQWWANGSKLADQTTPKISGSTSATLTLKAVANVTNIKCQVMTIDGLASAISNTVSLTKNDAPVISSQPSGTISVQSGKPLVIEVGVASNASNTISWSKNNTPVAGQTSATLSITSATTSDAGQYVCVVTNGCGVVSSSACTVTIALIQDFTSVEEIDMNSLGLHETTPNPTNDVTNISFNLTNSSNVKLTISDVYGNQIATLFEGMSNSGIRNFSFSGNQFNLNSGVYFVTLSSAGMNQTKKFTLVK